MVEDGRVLLTNQYTFTERFRPILLPDFSNLASLQNAVLPVIFWVYDLSPFMVEVRRSHAPLTQLLTHRRGSVQRARDIRYAGVSVAESCRDEAKLVCSGISIGICVLICG